MVKIVSPWLTLVASFLETPQLYQFDVKVGSKTLETVPPGKRKRGRPNQRWVDCVNRDMRAIGTSKDEVHDITGWRRMVSVAATSQPSRSG